MAQPVAVDVVESATMNAASAGNAAAKPARRCNLRKPRTAKPAERCALREPRKAKPSLRSVAVTTSSKRAHAGIHRMIAVTLVDSFMASSSHSHATDATADFIDRAHRKHAR